MSYPAVVSFKHHWNMCPSKGRWIDWCAWQAWPMMDYTISRIENTWLIHVCVHIYIYSILLLTSVSAAQAQAFLVHCRQIKNLERFCLSQPCRWSIWGIPACLCLWISFPERDNTQGTMRTSSPISSWILCAGRQPQHAGLRTKSDTTNSSMRRSVEPSTIPRDATPCARRICSKAPTTPPYSRCTTVVVLNFNEVTSRA